MEALTKAAVAEICELVDDSYAELQLEISRSHEENEALRRKLELIETIIARGHRGGVAVLDYGQEDTGGELLGFTVGGFRGLFHAGVWVGGWVGVWSVTCSVLRRLNATRRSVITDQSRCTLYLVPGACFTQTVYRPSECIDRSQTRCL